MLILHDENNLIIGLQLFPKTSDQPHIVADDDQFEVLEPLVGKAHLAEGEEGLMLPPGWESLSNAILEANISEQEYFAVQSAVQGLMDKVAREHGYDDIKTAVTYAEEPAVPKFQIEGQAFRAWRSLCWDYCYAQLDAVKSGERERPASVEEFLLELPELEIPYQQ